MEKSINFFDKYWQWVVVLIALLLFAAKLPFVFVDPFFPGDSGYRMMKADRLVLILGDDTWLPFLQAHIGTFFKLNIPYYFYKIIPCLYYFVSMLFLAKLADRIAGNDIFARIFSVALLIAYSYQKPVMFLSVNMYQEILAASLLFAMIYFDALDLKKSKGILLLATIAILTRETFWVYLAVLSLVNLKKILSDRTYVAAFAWLWGVVIAWLSMIFCYYWIKLGRVPAIPYEWPFMINKEPFTISSLVINAGSLMEAIVMSKTHYLIICMGSAWLVMKVYVTLSGRKESSEPDIIQKIKMFSLLSLGIMYTTVLLVNPWEHTYGNPRMAAPLFFHLFLWILIQYRMVRGLPKGVKIFTRSLLVIGLLLSMNWNVSQWVPKDRLPVIAAYERISSTCSKVKVGKKGNVYIVVKDFWRDLQNLVVPTLYFDHTFSPNNLQEFPQEVDVVITRKQEAPLDKRFVKKKRFKIAGIEYKLFVRK